MMTTQEILEAARSAKTQIAQAGSEQKNAALRAMADYLEAESGAILTANEADLITAKGQISEVMMDRLRLTKERIADMAEGIRQVAALPDPVGKIRYSHSRPNGLQIDRVALAKWHLSLSTALKGPVTGILEMRRHLACYFKGLPDFKETRVKLVTAPTAEEVDALLDYISERWGNCPLNETSSVYGL